MAQDKDKRAAGNAPKLWRAEESAQTDLMIERFRRHLRSRTGPSTMPDDQMSRSFSTETLLGRISEGARSALSSKWRVENHDANYLIIGANDPGRDVYFLLSGSVRAAAFTMDGKEVSFNIIHQGDCFGEIAAIDGGVRSSSVVAMEAVSVARLNPTDFLNLLESNSELTRAFLHLMCGKIRFMSDKLLSFTELTTPQRVRQELVALARDARKLNSISGDGVLITNMPTQGEIGKNVLARREAVAREMSSLRAKGLIEKRAGALWIPSVRRLEAEILL